MPDSSRIISGKKFMWDGVVYPTQEEAQGVVEKYRKDNFEVESEEEENQFLVYTRRAVKEIVLDGKPPA
ncbi:MAG: hypothetical protein A2V86_09525 [Deltaproteobacteria bacterium RBG_16_49_23]|nr:MAG: hypothetical protein A2V86_09525 [Deltaproteobacteria bacterium RBG_16_49_23]